MKDWIFDWHTESNEIHYILDEKSKKVENFHFVFFLLLRRSADATGKNNNKPLNRDISEKILPKKKMEKVKRKKKKKLIN